MSVCSSVIYVMFVMDIDMCLFTDVNGALVLRCLLAMLAIAGLHVSLGS